MAKITQKDRVLRVDSPAGEDVLLLSGFSGVEEISTPFRFILELLSEKPTIDPEGILRQPMTVSIRLADGSERVIHGIVARFTQLGRMEELSAYQAEIVPWLWFLSLTRDCRIFQEKSVLEIITEILDDYENLEYDVRTVGSYQPRGYCVQYRETDLDFVSRLMEEEGIFYFFEHSTSGHKLVLGDDSSVFKDCLQKEARFSGSPGGWTDEDVLTGIVREHAVHTTAVTLTDYDDLQPSLDLLSSAVKGSDNEIYDYPGKYTNTTAGERYASLRLESLASLGEVVRGTGNCRTFQSGQLFAIADYFKDNSNKKCLLLSVGHTGRGGGYRSGADQAHYSNQFECIPAEVPFRPFRKTEKPIVRGSQTAVVVGPAGEEIYTDEHGRVKVQFHWDRAGKKNEGSSCWIRVSQPWAGKSWGAVAIPRIGQEVIVDFLEGDPDRPIITGRVYNKTQTPPYALPGNKTQTGIKSRSSKGGNGATFNEIRMEDKKGEELLYLHAERDKQVVVEKDRFEEVGSNESIKIGGDRSESVGKNEGINIGANQTLTVEASRTVSVSGDMSLTVGKNNTDDVGSNQTETIGKNKTVSVGKDQNLSVGENWVTKVGKNHTESVGKAFTLQAKDGVLIESKKEIVIKAGSASITLKKNGDIEIKGKKINVKGSGDVTIKGSKITEN